MCRTLNLILCIDIINLYDIMITIVLVIKIIIAAIKIFAVYRINGEGGLAD